MKMTSECVSAEEDDKRLKELLDLQVREVHKEQVRFLIILGIITAFLALGIALELIRR